jgi:hypothetical protein
MDRVWSDPAPKRRGSTPLTYDCAIVSGTTAGLAWRLARLVDMASGDWDMRLILSSLSICACFEQDGWVTPIP